MKTHLYLIPFLLLVMGCSLKGADILSEIKQIQKNRDRYSFDKKYAVATKKLRDRHQKSLMAHVTYITARGGSRVMLAEYKGLAEKRKTPFYDYLHLRAELTRVGYREMAKRNDIVGKLEKIALENSSLKEEALYDLTSGYYLLRDKLKKRQYVDELIKIRPKYEPYQRLRASVLVAHDEAKDIIELCERGLKGQNLELGYCRKLSELNEDNAKNYLEKRDSLLEKMVLKASKKRHADKRNTVWNFLHTIADNGAQKAKALKDRLVTEVLKQEKNWIPREVYRKYYGDIDYEDFEFILKIGKINKVIDFKKRVAAFNELLTPELSKKRKSQVYSSLGLAFLNPANQDKKKAFQYLIQANELEPLSSYATFMLLDLILELKVDADIGLLIVDDRLETSNEEASKMNLMGDKSIDDFVKYSKGDLATLYLYQGRLYNHIKKTDKARLAFLHSFQLKEGASNSYYLGELFSQTNPMVAIDFLAHSFKSEDKRNPLGEKLTQKRERLFNKLYRQYFGNKIDQKELLAVYKDKGEKLTSDVHSFVGKPLVTDKVLDFKGGDYDWSALKGKKVILSFWATWCTPCFQEMAVLNKIQKEGKIKNLKIVGVCTDGLAQRKKVKKILKNGQIDFDIILDDGTFKNKYLVAAIPSMFFVGEKGSFIKQKTGYSPELEKEILALFK